MDFSAFFIYMMCLNKSLGISASSAQILGSFSAFKALSHIRRPLGIQDVNDIILEYIPESYHAVAVEAAGHYRSVNEDPELVLKPIAKEPITLDLPVTVGPFETLAPFQIYIFTNPHAAGVFLPFAVQGFL